MRKKCVQLWKKVKLGWNAELKSRKKLKRNEKMIFNEEDPNWGLLLIIPKLEGVVALLCIDYRGGTRND